MKTIVIAVLLLVAVGAGTAAWLRHEDSAVLRAEVALRRDDQRELQRVQAENARLKAAAIAPDELNRLRSEHAAIGRLRAELEALRDNVEKRERALAGPEDRRAKSSLRNSAAAADSPAPALVLPLELAANGALSLEGAPIDLPDLRARLAPLPAGTAVEIRLREPRIDSKDRDAAVQQHLAIQRGKEGLVRLGRELGLKLTVRSERPKA